MIDLGSTSLRSQRVSDMGTVVLKDQFEIDDSLHLPGYDSPTAKLMLVKASRMGNPV